jgi:hypothetical protein
MTRYLDGKPFSSKAATDAYRDGWEATFGSRPGDRVLEHETHAAGARERAEPHAAALDNRGRGWIQTYSGGRFYPVSPRADEVNLRDIGHALSNLCRFTGHCYRFYSVAEHSVRVADAVARNYPGATPEVLLFALLHDASEAYLTDLPRPLKEHSELGRLYRIAESHVEAVICEHFDLAPTDEVRAAVKHADNVLLATEARDLMPQREVAAWSWMPEPLPELICPREPVDAFGWFMSRAVQFRNAR